MPQHPGKNKGGRIPPDGRSPQAKGVGKNSKRHDLERRSVPFLHGSDLQQGDVQALQQGQRIAPKQTQQPGQTPQPQTSSPQQGGAAGTEVPDPIEFIAGRSSGQVNPTGAPPAASPKAGTWLPILQKMAQGPGVSGNLAGALISQGRALRQIPRREATVVDMQAIDDGLEAMLDAGI